MKLSRLNSLLVVLLLILTLGPAEAQRPAYGSLKARADKAMSSGDIEKAVILYEKLAGFYPNSSEAHNSLGLAHFKKKNDPRAIYSFRRSLSLNRNNGQALHNLILASGRQADAFARNNQFAESEQVLSELISSYSWHPQHAVLLYYRGRMEFSRGRAAQGLAWWKKASRIAPNSGVAKVMAAQSRPLNSKTVQLYRSAAESVKKEPAFHYLLGKRQLEAQQYENALATLSLGLEKSRKASIPFPLLSLTTAQAALALGRADEAVEILEEAKSQRPDWASLRTLLWVAYMEVNQPGKADSALQDAYELDQKSKIALLGSPSNRVRLTTPNGSLLLTPPTAISVPSGTSKLTSGGQDTSVQIGSRDAYVFEVDGGGQVSTRSQAQLQESVGSAGQLAPALVAKDRRGRIYRLADNLLKRPVVLLFWRADLPSATEQITTLGAIATRYGEGIETAAIHTAPRYQKDAHRLYLSQPSTTAQLWGDNTMPGQFGADSVPSVVVIDKQGRIINVRSGGTEEMFGNLTELLDTL